MNFSFKDSTVHITMQVIPTQVHVLIGSSLVKLHLGNIQNIPFSGSLHCALADDPIVPHMHALAALTITKLFISIIKVIRCPAGCRYPPVPVQWRYLLSSTDSCWNLGNSIPMETILAQGPAKLIK